MTGDLRERLKAEISERVRETQPTPSRLARVEMALERERMEVALAERFVLVIPPESTISPVVQGQAVARLVMQSMFRDAA